VHGRALGVSKDELMMMNCPACGRATPAAAEFCMRCGTENVLVQALDTAVESVMRSAAADTRSIDLLPETISAFRTDKLGPMQLVGKQLGIDIVDLNVGNIGYHCGQWVSLRVRLPSDQARRNEACRTGIELANYAFGGDPDVVSVRVEFVDRRGRHTALSITDTTDCSQALAADEPRMDEFIREHTDFTAR
jgi:hypothetical protein